MIGSLLFPPRCAFCRTLLPVGGEENFLCEACLEKSMSQWLPDRMENLPGTAGIAAPLLYRSGVRQALKRFKFGGKRAYYKLFAGLMYNRVSAEYLWSFDFVTWVPIGAFRKFRRGYNQCELMGRELAKRLGLPCGETMKKRPFIKHQSRLAAKDRRKNIVGAFSILDPSAVVGRKVLLVDDISTTGATLTECTRVLKSAGASAVYCIIVAKTLETEKKY